MISGIPPVRYLPLPSFLIFCPALLAVALAECHNLEEVNMKFCHYVTSGGLRIIVNNRGASLRSLVSVGRKRVQKSAIYKQALTGFSAGLCEQR